MPVLLGTDQLDLGNVISRFTPSRNSTILLSGSFAAGLAHARSDLDIHFIGDPPNPGDLEVSGFRVQFTRVPNDIVELGESLGRNDLATAQWSRVYFLSDRERWELFRLATAKPIRVSESHHWITSSLFRQSVRQIQMGTSAHQIARTADDIRGLVESNETDAARDLVRQLFRETSSMVLAAHGDLYASDKFLLPRLRRSMLNVSEMNWLVKGYQDAARDLHWLPKIQALSAFVQLEGWHKLLTGDSLSLIDHPGSARWTRSPNFWLVRRPDSVMLSDSGAHGFKVPQDLAVLWVMSEAGNLDAVTEAVNRAGYELSRSSVASGLEKLLELELIDNGRR